MSSPSPEFDLLAPIAGENPSGKNLRGTALYDAVKRARRLEPGDAGGGDNKGGGPSRASRIQATIEPCAKALATESKDLQIAVWLTDARISRDGLAGLAKGLNTCRGLLEQFWDTLYPEIEAGDLEPRINLLEWLGKEQRLSDSPVNAVRRTPITADGRTLADYANSLVPPKDKRRDDQWITAKEFNDSFDATPKAYYKQHALDVQAAAAELEALEKVLDHKFGREAPGLGDLRRVLEELSATIQTLLQRKLEKEPDLPTPEEQAPILTEEPTVDVPAVEISISSGGSAPISTAAVSAMDAPELIVAAAHALRRVSPSDVRPYLVLRALRWGELRSGGPDLQDNCMSGPSTEVRLQLKALANAGRWAELLEMAESVVGTDCGRAWLDVQRYSVIACEKLGYETVAAALKAELKCLLDAYPSLPSRTLLDDTGTANPITAAWLSSGMKLQE